jgi:5'-nucleotidase
VEYPKILMDTAQILLTNDDGIVSPGLWAAAQALSKIGFVHVIAPREQSSGTGRSLPVTSDGVIRQEEVQVGGQTWKVYAVGGSPAQAVLHAVLEVLPERPSLVVSGINYGENVGSGITISGTVGAAMESAALGIPSLAVSLETDRKHHYSHSSEVDFSSAAYFTAYFAHLILQDSFPPDVDILKVDIPCDAVPDTPWEVTRMSRSRYFEATPPERDSWETPARIGYRQSTSLTDDTSDSDAYALSVKRIVSVTPLSLDLTSRIDLKEFERQLRKKQAN